MSIFGSIQSKIFSHPAAAATTATAVTAAPDAPEVGAPTPTSSVPVPAPAADSALESGADPGPGTAAAPPVQRVDVEAVLSDLASRNPQSLNWKNSIVDLMKLLDLDSSLHARTELAGELHYTGDTSDSATMNLWLHKEVMRQLEANGGKVPADLKN